MKGVVALLDESQIQHTVIRGSVKAARQVYGMAQRIPGAASVSGIHLKAGQMGEKHRADLGTRGRFETTEEIGLNR